MNCKSVETLIVSISTEPPQSLSTGSVKPRWLRDLVRFLPLKSQFVLSGNVLDLQAYEVAAGSISVIPLQAAVARELYSFGYETVLSVDRVRGPMSLSNLGMPQPASEVLNRLGIELEATCSPSLNQLGHLLERVVLSTGTPIALILDFASRLVGRVDFVLVVRLGRELAIAAPRGMRASSRKYP